LPDGAVLHIANGNDGIVCVYEKESSIVPNGRLPANAKFETKTRGSSNDKSHKNYDGNKSIQLK
jgi:hypothetical protein